MYPYDDQQDPYAPRRPQQQPLQQYGFQAPAPPQQNQGADLTSALLQASMMSRPPDQNLDNSKAGSNLSGLTSLLSLFG